MVYAKGTPPGWPTWVGYEGDAVVHIPCCTYEARLLEMVAITLTNHVSQ